tara:strand:+ start:253 stop:441 length:189 start_codon:yes stop_codon:yes gene_type:complete
MKIIINNTEYIAIRLDYIINQPDEKVYDFECISENVEDAFSQLKQNVLVTISELSDEEIRNH